MLLIGISKKRWVKCRRNKSYFFNKYSNWLDKEINIPEAVQQFVLRGNIGLISNIDEATNSSRGLQTKLFSGVSE